MNAGEIVVSLLELVARVAPGVLAAITNKRTDREAIDDARARVVALPQYESELDEDAERRKRGE